MIVFNLLMFYNLILRVIQQLKDKGYNFSDCIYCDAKIDAYFTLRASYSFFLAEDGIYSGAVEQILNELFEENKKDLIQFIYSNKGEGGRHAIDLIMVAKYLERIADHATNIAEWVEFSITGVHKGEKV